MFLLVAGTFESSVDSYGSQTYIMFLLVAGTFESSVDSYGSQTDTDYNCRSFSLRVV